MNLPRSRLLQRLIEKVYARDMDVGDAMRTRLEYDDYLFQCGKAEAYAEICRDVHEIDSDWLAGDDGPSQD